jgi:hypothetical protein
VGLLIIHKFCQWFKTHRFLELSNLKSSKINFSVSVIAQYFCHPSTHPPKQGLFFFPSQVTLNRHLAHSSFANSLQDNPARLAKYSGAEKKFGNFGNKPFWAKFFKTISTHLLFLSAFPPFCVFFLFHTMFLFYLLPLSLPCA